MNTYMPPLPRAFRSVGIMYALIATGVTVGVPLLGVIAISSLVGPLSPLVVSVIAVALAVAASTLGNAAWMRHPASDRVAFGELMLWSWLRRTRSDRTLVSGNRELEQSGASTITPAERLHVLKQMSKALDRKDAYTYGHSRRVERLANATGLALNLRGKEQHLLCVAAAIHDVGKIHVPDEILRKEGALTDAEYTAIKAHAAMGSEMVAHMGKAEITEAVRHHHERWDGRGYPDGISGEEIPVNARIIGVADAYDAMTSTRSYRNSLGRKKAIAILREESGRQFDPQVVSAFLSTISKPVAAALLLPASSVPSVVQRITRWFGWGSRTQLGTAATSVGLAIVISSSMFSPLETPARGARQDDGSTQVLGNRVRAEGTQDSHRSRGSAESSRAGSSRREVDGRRSRAKTGSTPNSPTVKGGAGGDAGGDSGAAVASGDSGGSSSGTGTGTAPAGSIATDPEEAVPVQETQDWDPEADSDPKPARGADCDGAVAATKGGSVHCDG